MWIVVIILAIWFIIPLFKCIVSFFSEDKSSKEKNETDINVENNTPNNQRNLSEAKKDILEYDESGKVVIGNNDITARHIVIPSGVESIGDKAFRGCNRMQSIKIPNSVTHIGNEAFEGCSHLLRIDIPNGVASIGDSAFYGTSFLFIVMHPLMPETIEISEKCFTPHEYNMNTLVVPSSALEKYQRHPFFGKFQNIKTMP